MVKLTLHSLMKDAKAPFTHQSPISVGHFDKSGTNMNFMVKVDFNLTIKFVKFTNFHNLGKGLNARFLSHFHMMIPQLILPSFFTCLIEGDIGSYAASIN